MKNIIILTGYSNNSKINPADEPNLKFPAVVKSYHTESAGTFILIEGIEGTFNLNNFEWCNSLPYCLDNGVEYYVIHQNKTANVIALIQDENIFLLTKENMQEMAFTAKIKGIEKVILHTNYGVELHSIESPDMWGFNSIIKFTF